MRSSNPALNDKVFANLAFDESTRMTLQGTVIKSAILLTLAFTTAAYTWNLFFSGNVSAVYPLWIGGMVVGLVLAMITIFKPKAAPITAPMYALAKGFMIGGISAFVQAQFPDVPIVVQAAALTFLTFAGLLAAYMSGLIKPTENFKLGIVAATMGIFLLYLMTFVLGFFGVAVPYLHGSGPIGIAFSVAVCAIAALNLVLDFDFIENGAERGAPKYMEWYGAFGLLVTLIWLYIEILHLLAKLQSRR
ncbi:MAG: Bax inhibitor-1/YccA family protein [Proteobacteria bacterium]|nr:Bax inhibitor-1/YccA family protein [Pseudomonadota bacterium]